MKNMRIGKNGWITWRIDVKMHEEQIVACLFMAVIFGRLTHCQTDSALMNVVH